MRKTEKPIEWITAQQVNSYIIEQMETLFQQEGFEMGRQEGFLLRLKEHHLQIICRVGLEEIKLKLIIAPSWLCCDSYHHSKNIRLKWSNLSDLRSNIYTDIAFKQRISSKVFYQKEEFFHAWDTAILPELQEDVIGMYDTLDFDTYARICEEEGQGWTVGYEDEICRNLVIGYNNFWNRQYERGKPYLESAILEMGKNPTRTVQGCKNEYTQDIENAKAILDIYEERKAGWEENVSDQLLSIERMTVQQYLL